MSTQAVMSTLRQKSTCVEGAPQASLLLSSPDEHVFIRKQYKFSVAGEHPEKHLDCSFEGIEEDLIEERLMIVDEKRLS